MPIPANAAGYPVAHWIGIAPVISVKIEVRDTFSGGNSSLP
jgi:hypothetical protein